MEVAKGLPDLERIVSRIHAKNCKVRDFLKVLKVILTIVIYRSSNALFPRQSFTVLSKGLSKLADASETFESKTILGLLRSAPDLLSHIKNVESRFETPEKGMEASFQNIAYNFSRRHLIQTMMTCYRSKVRMRRMTKSRKRFVSLRTSSTNRSKSWRSRLGQYRPFLPSRHSPLMHGDPRCPLQYWHSAQGNKVSTRAR